MTSKKAYFGMIGAIALSVGAVFGMLYLGNSMLVKKSDELMDLKVKSELLNEQQTALNRAIRDIETYGELESTAKAIVPQDKDQARTVREIVKIANETGAGFSNISFPSSSLGEIQQRRGGSSSGSSQRSNDPPVTQVEPVEGMKGVYQMEITIQSDTTNPISYANLLNFLSKLEQNRRTAQVSTINITPTEGNVNFVIGIKVYIKP